MADRWSEDRWFGYQFLNGANPATICRCTALPENFPVTNKDVSDFLDRGKNLQQEMKVLFLTLFFHQTYITNIYKKLL
jgi:hypothetical protein